MSKEGNVGVVRKLMLLLMTLIVLVVLLIVFQFTDVAFRVWDRLQQTSTGFLLVYATGVGLIALLGAGLAYRIWTVGRRSRRKPAMARTLTLEALRARREQAVAQGIDTSAVDRELAQLASKEVLTQTLEVAFFGQISTGKSSLIQTLLPQARVETSIIGGSTACIERYVYEDEQGLNLVLLDMPGTHQALALEGVEEAVLEVTRRVHLVVYVVDKDITASDAQALAQLAGFNKPLVVALNKANLYNEADLVLLKAQIAKRLPDEARLVVVESAHWRRVKVVNAQGEAQWQERLQKGQVQALLEALVALSGQREMLASKQRQALLALADEQLSLKVGAYRRERAQALVKAYARKAMVGGVAAVGPGTDVLIQGYLGLDMVKELCKLYEMPVKEVDLQRLVDSASSKVRGHMTVILALAGNVFKAFPGVGTVMGGASHALAYGLIFESLGKAMVQTLEGAQAENWSSQAVVDSFEEQLQYDLENRAQDLVKIATAGKLFTRR